MEAIMEKSVLESRLRKLEKMLGKISDVLRCPICLEIVQTRSRQCQEGHLMCAPCLDKAGTETCPSCLGPLLGPAVRNRSFEQIGEALLIACDNADRGCCVLLAPSEKATHALTCFYRQYPCTPGYPSCTWEGYKQEIHEHTLQHHPGSVLTSCDRVIQVPLSQQSVWLLFRGDDVFEAIFKVDESKDAILGSVSCLGLPESTDKLKYSFLLKNQHSEVSFKKNIQPERKVSLFSEDRMSAVSFHRHVLEDYLGRQITWSNKYHIEVLVSVEDERGNTSEPMVEGDAVANGSARDGVVKEEDETDVEKVGNEKEIVERVKFQVRNLFHYVPANYYSWLKSCDKEIKGNGYVLERTLTEIRNVIERSVITLANMFTDSKFDTVTMRTMSEARRAWAALEVGRMNTVRAEWGKRTGRESVRKMVAWDVATRLILNEAEGWAAEEQREALLKKLDNVETDRSIQEWKAKEENILKEATVRLLSMVEKEGGSHAVERSLRLLARDSMHVLFKNNFTELLCAAKRIQWCEMTP